MVNWFLAPFHKQNVWSVHKILWTYTTVTRKCFHINKEFITEVDSWFASKSSDFKEDGINGISYWCEICNRRWICREGRVIGLNFRSLAYPDHDVGKNLYPFHSTMTSPNCMKLYERNFIIGCLMSFVNILNKDLFNLFHYILSGINGLIPCRNSRMSKVTYPTVNECLASKFHKPKLCQTIQNIVTKGIFPSKGKLPDTTCKWTWHLTTTRAVLKDFVVIYRSHPLWVNICSINVVDEKLWCLLLVHCTRARWKVLSLANNQCDTGDKGALGRDSDSNWCHCHTGVKPFWSQSMEPWAVTKTSFTLVWWWHQLLSRTLP